MRSPRKRALADTDTPLLDCFAVNSARKYSGLFSCTSCTSIPSGAGFCPFTVWTSGLVHELGLLAGDVLLFCPLFA